MKNKIELRDYQKDLVVRFNSTILSGCKRIMMQLPTGGGKTVVFGAIANDFVFNNKRVLVLAHRVELILQASKKLKAIANCETGIIKSGYPQNIDAPIQIASIQSLVNRLNLFDSFDLIIVDEAHHSTSKTYRKILSHYSTAIQLGVTATPIRLDGSGFRDVFDELISGITVRELIDKKYLSPFSLYAHNTTMTTKGVKTINGDFSSSEIARNNDAINLSGHLINSYRQYANGLKCLVFAINIDHSRIICDRYNQMGISAIHLDGHSKEDERKEALQKFADGEIKVITNCNLFDEGLDIPCLEAVQVARPTRSISKWLQMVGRSLRTSENKEKAIIIDHTENWAFHGLPTKPRIWTLDGIETKNKTHLERKESGEIREVIVTEDEDFLLTEIDSSVETEWQQLFDDLIQKRECFGFKKGWLYYQLIELKPPLEIWIQCEKYLGYRRGWASHRYKEQIQTT